MRRSSLLFILIFNCILGVFAQEVQKQDYIRHNVMEGESVNAIAAFYDISVEELFQLNPGARSELKPGDVLLIPQKNTTVQTDGSQAELSFKRHRVRRKETLYSISKRYDVPIEDIKRYNEELYERELRKGEKIRIPIYNIIPPEVIAENSGRDTVMHIVQSKETRWGIANSYGITIDQLHEFNPEMQEVIKTGDTLYLPGREQIAATPSTEDYVFYEVKPKETLYSLSRFLNIPEVELQILNPDLEYGLKAGMILKIPRARVEDLDVRNDLIVKKFNLTDSINTSHVSNIAFMLPFKLKNIRTDSLELVKEKFRSDRAFNYAMDFYSGALIAVDSVKKMGLSVNIKVFDTEGSKSKIDQLLLRNSFTNFHAVIGPFYSSPFNTLSQALRTDDIPIIAPLTNKNISLYSNVFQTVPSETYLRGRMMDFMGDHAADKQIIIVTDNKNNETVKKLQSRFPDAKTIMPEKDRTITIYLIRRLLSEEKENWILLETTSQSLVANVTSVLNSIKREKYKMTLLTTYKSGAFDSDSDNVSNTHLSNLSFHYPTIDKLSALDNSFSKKYEAAYYTTPSRYAIRGFDITFDILLRLAYGGDLYKAARYVGETSYVENKFDYGKKFLGGWYNKACYIVKYDNLEIKEVNQ